jgi:hypothetical protein
MLGFLSEQGWACGRIVEVIVDTRQASGEPGSQVRVVKISIPGLSVEPTVMCATSGPALRSRIRDR